MLCFKQRRILTGLSTLGVYKGIYKRQTTIYLLWSVLFLDYLLVYLLQFHILNLYGLKYRQTFLSFSLFLTSTPKSENDLIQS